MRDRVGADDLDRSIIEEILNLPIKQRMDDDAAAGFKARPVELAHRCYKRLPRRADIIDNDGSAVREGFDVWQGDADSAISGTGLGQDEMRGSD